MVCNSLKISIVAIVSFAIASCGGKVENETTLSEHQVKEQKLQNIKITGLWESESLGSQYEFFPSVINGPEESDLKTGRIIKSGKVVSEFWWTASPSGVISMNLVGVSCNHRPILYCDVTGLANITARGNSLQEALWTIEYDDNQDGETDRKEEGRFKPSLIGLNDLNQEELFLKESEYFSFSTKINIVDSKVAIHLNHLGETVVAEGDFPVDPKEFISLSAGSDNSVSTHQDFLIEGVGYKSLKVEKRYQNITLRKSINNGVSLSYEIDTSITVPEEFSGLNIDKGEVENSKRFTQVGEVVGDFINPDLQVEEQEFATYIPYVFSEEYSTTGAANRLAFNSDGTGRLYREDLLLAENSESVGFVWSEDEGKISLSLDNDRAVELRFIKPSLGGYQVLYQVQSDEFGVDYIIHDLLIDSSVDISEQVPGIFQFESTDGFSKTELSFNTDGSVTFKDIPNLSGFWFVDDFGSLVSYECVDIYGVEIEIYQECVDYFGTIATNPMVTFAHIRRINFIAGSGNHYVAQYDANFWGGIFGNTGSGYKSIAMTYRASRLGDAND